jgi:tetratricopeptide (TPR) repeat protein
MKDCRKRRWLVKVGLILFTLYGFLPTSLAQTDQRTFDQFFMEAMVQRQKGNNDAAFDLLRHCQELNPDAPEVYFFLGQYYSLLKNPEKSLACVKRAAALAPENEIYMETLAQTYIRQQDYASAIPVFEGIYARNKDREDMLEMLFQLYQQVDDYEQAVGVLNRIEAIDGKSERLSLAKREIYSRMGDKKAVVAEMEALAKQYPNDLNYRVMYGESLMMNGQTKKALNIYHQVLDQEPDNNRVLMSLRTYYQSQGDKAVADSLTERVLLNRSATTEEKVHLLRQEIATCEASGDSTRVLTLFRKMLAQPQAEADMALFCASYMSAKKMPKDSIRPVLEQVLKMAPDQAAARLQLVGYAWEDENLDRVIALCQDARQYNPDEMAFYYYQGIAYYKREQLDDALSAFRNGIDVIADDSDPVIVSDFYAVMGDILHQKGLAEEAFAAYDSCLQWKDDNIGCLNNYAYYLSERGERLDTAEAMSFKTVKAEPKNATYLDTYAWILFMQKRYSEAKIYIDQALQHMGEDAPGNEVIIEHAGDIYALNKDMERALSLWRDAQQKKPEDRLLQKKIKQKKYIKE